MRFKIIASSSIPTNVIVDIENTLSRAFNAYTRVISIENIPSECYNPLRGQYRADLVNIWLMSKYGRDLRGNDYVVAILDVDAYVPGLNFVFGLASPSMRVASIYTYRLRFTYPGLKLKKDELFMLRIRKEVMHEVGHLLGLDHCYNSKCVMYFSNSILDTDNKDWRYCPECASKLRGKGIVLNADFIIT